jgi:hypothetical protein
VGIINNPAKRKDKYYPFFNFFEELLNEEVLDVKSSTIFYWCLAHNNGEEVKEDELSKAKQPAKPE